MTQTGRPARFTLIEQQQIVDDYNGGASQKQLSRKHHCNMSTIYNVLKCHGVKLRPFNLIYEPTPEEITAGTAKIRQKWTPVEERQRNQHPVNPANPQVCPGIHRRYKTKSD